MNLRLPRPWILLLALALPDAALAQARTPRGTVVIAQGGDAVSVIPIFAAERSGQELTDQLFLRLAEMGPTLSTIGDDGFVPMLAKRWSRRDSLTLIFDLDARARWHDGHPVTAEDVVFTFDLAMKDPRLATAIGRIASVTAEGPRRVVIAFREAYPEQFYDATWHVQPMPAHLLRGIPFDSIPHTAFAQAPVGDGPFMWSRRVPGQFIELRANRDFFLGAPGLERVLFRVVGDVEARLNLLLSGEVDVMSDVRYTMLPRLEQAPRFRVIQATSTHLYYILFNQRDPGDTTRAHPILSDRRVRRALVLAMDRQAIARSMFGRGALVPDGPAPQFFHWIEPTDAPPVRHDPARARALLDAAGWRDTDGDGTRDRDGRPLRLSINTPSVDQTREDMSLKVQQQLRAVGVDLQVSSVAWPTWLDRHNTGQFELNFARAVMDPSPAGLRNSWICASAGKPGQNVASWCNPTFDSLLSVAGRSQEHPVELYRQAMAVAREDMPAAFMAAPPALIAVHRRYDHVRIRPEALWLSLREWTVKPDQMLPRDRTGGR